MNPRLSLLMLAIVLLLAGCRPAQNAPTATRSDPAAVLTAAANTAIARLTAQAAQVTPTSSATPTLTPTTPVSTATPTAPPATAAPGSIDQIEFIADITVPDGTLFNPGEGFTKIWRLKNIGNTTWTSAYALVFVSGAPMGNSGAQPLPAQVAPGETVDVSVNLVAPAEPGDYTGFWMLRNANQKNFGLGPNADQPFYVQIRVSGAAPLVTQTPASGSPGTPISPLVSGLKISLDNGQVEAACPYTFHFTAEFSLSQATTVTYQLEAETGFPLTLPAPTTALLDAGTHQVAYELEFSASVTGWARLRVTAPQNAVSNQVNFVLTCQ
jgi:hypothetical protein